MRSLLIAILMTSSPCCAASELSGNVLPFEEIGAAQVRSVNPPCQGDDCKERHALIFIHGIFGDDTTFSNSPNSVNPRVAGTPRIEWPRLIPEEISGKKVDVYVVKYQSALLTWMKKKISTLDEVVYGVFKGIESEVLRRPYKSIGIIGHSLGGNVAAAYLHTVKTELGHSERARHAFIVTLASPTDGADIASAALIMKNFLNTDDPLLESLRTDNSFLRMLAYWYRSGEGRLARCDGG